MTTLQLPLSLTPRTAPTGAVVRTVRRALHAVSVFSLCLSILSALLVAPSALAQTCSIPGQAGNVSLTAQPNSFFAGTGSPGSNAVSINVGAGTGLNSNVQPGDMLLIIQMQGADIDSTNTNSYGDGTADAGVTNTVAFGAAGYAGGISGSNFVAGNYEWAVATGGGATFAAGGTINLSRGLTRGYFSQAGSATTSKQSWQVVRVPQFSNVTLASGLTVQAWDGSTGGILSLDAAGTINLNGQTIDGNGRGFRGAGGVNVNPQCTNTPSPVGCPEYRSLISTQLGGSKAEGLAGTPGRVYSGDPNGAGVGTIAAGADGYINGDLSRGAPGNAGGGGNQHNAGGGGGGNGGAGGNGGNSWNNSQAAYVGTPVGGFGGAPAPNTATRWLLGGGGGAADLGGNGTTAPDGSGGAAGAMVIFRASQLQGAGTININGAIGQNSRATDGAGGGGAGGTVVLALGTGGAAGAIAVNAGGGKGGNYGGGGNEQDGAGGGGGGGALIHNLAVGTVTFSASGGAIGGTNSGACPPATPGADCGQRAGFGTAGAVTYVNPSTGVLVGYECLPNLTVSKATGTPLVTSATGATASYTINVTNSGGAARFVDVLDTALPPGWTLASAPTYVYSPPQPLAAGVLSSGAETIVLASSSTWSVGAAPVSVPATGSNSLTWSSFALAPVNNGVPSAVTVTFIANIPDTAAVGTYHNGAGVTFLDPTRTAVRTVSPLTNVSANRTGTPYSANTTYANYNGAATTPVASSNYNGTPTGPTFDDVRLIADFSISKTAPATATTGTTFTYTLTPRNNGRGVGSQTFAVSQATDVSTANVPTLLGSSPVTLTDTLPAGVTLSTAFNGAGWTCTGTSTVVCTLLNTSAYPVAAASNFPLVTATASITLPCTPAPAAQTNSVAISSPANESVTSNNTATAVTAVTCAAADLRVTKTNGTATLVAGSTTSYTVTVANFGPNSAPGTVIKDPAVTGLNCTSVTCAVTAGTASCPTPLSMAVLQSTGLSITPTFNASSTLTFVVTCGVTATGQ